ncbi:hypothetical protein [Photobacterium damselae]|uniref:hypothetical protein n=1 Tax=Photobacterium damselae TaxID=38293 RepID=UPI000D05C23E|nr:hypothetical protein [Photobacterium damselae]PSB84810.1 hypothetical protein C5F62_05765 [Photobacterium damselae subsp. damselae]
MNRYHQQGMSTLLITSMLLVVALIFSLASYKNLFYQIKRTQNEVLARQAHWAAEGGLECGFAKVQLENNLSSIENIDYFDSSCSKVLGLEKITVKKIDKIYYLTSLYKKGSINKNINKSFTLNQGASGALQSTSDLYINGSSTFSTPDPGENNGGWECVAIRYKNIFSSRAGANNQGVKYGEKPSADFNNGGVDCKESHLTVTSIDSGYKNDFIKDVNVDPFYNTFGKTRDKWKEIKKEWSFAEVLPTKTIEAPAGRYFKVVEDCGGRIATEIELKKKRIWVSGSCEITSSTKLASGKYPTDSEGKEIKGGIDRIEEAFASTENKPVLLLVHDGVFSIQSSMDFPGLLYHLTTTLSPTEELWDQFEAKSYFGTYTLFPTLSKAKTAYFQRGAFTFSGGQVLDTNGLAAYFDQSLNFAFNSDNINEVTEKKGVRWVEGSWHDF